MSKFAFLPSVNEVAERCVFTPVCHSVHGGGGCLPHCMLEYTPPRADTPWADTPLGRQPPWEDIPRGQTTPPPQADGYCCRRYAAYWNAFLSLIFVCFVFRLRSFSRMILVGRRSYCGLSISPPVRGTQAWVPTPSNTVRKTGDISKIFIPYP